MISIRKCLSRLMLVLFLLGTLQALYAQAAPTYAGRWETLHQGGDPATVIDIVYIAYGFPDDSSLVNFKQYVSESVQFLNQYKPYSDYKTYFNIHVVYTYSTETGDSSDYSALYDIASQYAPDLDYWIVMHNKDGRSGGAARIDLYSSSYMHSAHTTAHELGHSIGSLVDEYVDAGFCPSGQYSGGEPGVNVTTMTDINKLKWSRWMGEVTQDINGDGVYDNFPYYNSSGQMITDQNGQVVPGVAVSNGIGIFQGAYFCAFGTYRPAQNCLMNAGDMFDKVCSEQVVYRFNSNINPVVSASPQPGHIPAVNISSADFQATLDPSFLPQGAPLQPRWYVDGTLASQSLSLQIPLGSLAPNRSHSVEFCAADPDVNGYSIDRPVCVKNKTAWTVDVATGLENINGRVTLKNGTPVKNATVNVFQLSSLLGTVPDVPTTTGITDLNGYYEFNLPPGAFYAVTGTANKADLKTVAQYLDHSAARGYLYPNTAMNADFIAVNPTGTFAAQITGPTNMVSGLQMHLVNQNGTKIVTGTTDSSGVMQLSLKNDTYVAFADNLRAGYAMIPSDNTDVFIYIVGNSVTKLYTLTAVNGYTLTGLITDSSGQGLAGISLRITDNNRFEQFVTTDAQGSYSVALLPALYYVQPHNLRYNFNPYGSLVNIDGVSDVVNFVGTLK